MSRMHIVGIRFTNLQILPPLSSHGKLMNVQLVDRLCTEFYTQNSRDAEALLSCAFPVKPVEKLRLRVSPSQLERFEQLGVQIHSPQDAVSLSHQLLMGSRCEYTLTYILSYMRSVIVSYVAHFARDQKGQLRVMLLEFLYRDAGRPLFIQKSAIALHVMILRLCWFELEQRDNNFMGEVDQFFTATPVGGDRQKYALLGLMLMEQLVAEMSQPHASHHDVNHMSRRKVLTSFRDTLLLKIYQFAIECLRGLYRGEGSVFHADGSDAALVQNAQLTCARVLLNCLSFDFIGTSLDESSDEATIVQIPVAWRPIIDSFDNTQIFWDCYCKWGVESSHIIMECLVCLLSVRKSVFSKDELRAAFVSGMLGNFNRVLSGSIGLQHVENFHALCRFLSRVTAACTPTGLSSTSEYSQFVELATEFTIKGFQSWRWSPNSISYILQFWSKIMVSLQYNRNEKLKILESRALVISTEFARACLELVTWEDDDPLENEEMLIPQLESFAILSRCNYVEVSKLLLSMFGTFFAEMKGIPNSAHLQQKKLAWITYMFGALVGSRTVYSSSEDDDSKDADMTCCVFEEMLFFQKFPTSEVGIALDLSILFFIKQFKTIYIGEKSQRSSIIFTKLTVAYGQAVPDLIVQKIISNLRTRSGSRSSIAKTIELFSDLCSGFTGIKFISKSETARMLLVQHSQACAEFLNAPNLLKMRCDFYSALGRLLIFEDGENVNTDFDAFVKSFEAILDRLLTISSPNEFQSPEAKNLLIRLFRDLKGVLTSFNNRRTYHLFFEWFFPTYITIVARTAQAYGSDHEIVVPMLKFLQEFSSNRSSRLNFDVSSANGILIFRQVSQVVAVLLDNQPILAPSDSAAFLSQCKVNRCVLNVMNAALAGRYVAFGVFRLYNDPCYDIALQSVFSMLLRCPAETILALPKFARSFYTFLEIILGETQIRLIPQIQPDLYMLVVQALDEGLKTHDPIVLQLACSALDNIASHVFTCSKSKNPANDMWHKLYSERKDIYAILFLDCFNALMAEDENSYALSRPLLPLLLLKRSDFSELMEKASMWLAVEARGVFLMAAQKITNSVEDNLLTKNRDVLTANITAFKRELVNPNNLPATLNALRTTKAISYPDMSGVSEMRI